MADATQPAPTLAEEFLAEFRAFWARLPDKPFFFTLLGAWAALFAVTGLDPRAAPSRQLVATVMAYGLFFAIFSGVVVSSLAPHAPHLHQ